MTDGPGADAKEIDLEDRDGFIEARFLRPFSVERFNRQAEAAAQACRERKRSKLLVDLTGLDAHPTTVERYELASHAVRVSAGVKVDAFTDRQKAVDRLLAGDSPGALGR